MTGDAWEELRDAFEAGASLSSLARRFGVSRNTIKKRRNDQGWSITDRAADKLVKEPFNPRALQDAARGKVIQLASRRVVENLLESGEIETVADMLAAQIPLSVAATKLARKLVQDALDGTAQPGPRESRATFTSAVIKSAADAAALARFASNLHVSGDERDGLTIEERILEPRKIDVNENGRSHELREAL